MRTRLVLKPGQDGTKKLVEEYGERLLCVRYRYDAAKGKRYKTVELILEESEWHPKPQPDEIVGVKVAIDELELRQKVKKAGGQWNKQRCAWELTYAAVVDIGLENRLVREADGTYLVDGVEGKCYPTDEDETDDTEGWILGGPPKENIPQMKPNASTPTDHTE